MHVLALDTATPMVSVVLAELRADEEHCRVLARRDEVADNRQGETLAPSIAAALAEAGLSTSDLTAVAVGLGPGPFTALRVGIVTAASLADALGIPAYGECSLDAVAARHSGRGGELLVLTDARRKQVYWARYAVDGARIDGPELAVPADLADRFRGQVDRVAGAGALMYRQLFADVEVSDDAPYPDAAQLAHVVAGRVRAAAPSDSLQPMYLRRPDARPPGPRKRVTPA